MKTSPRKTPDFRRVLVIEPDRSIRDTLGHLLVSRGYAVEYSRDEKTALESLMRGHLPNVILLELELRSASGWRFLAFQKTSKALRRIPTLVYSSRSRDPEIELLDSLDRLCEETNTARTTPDSDFSPMLHLPKRLARPLSARAS
jgi:CheY-like chemotaxis protein